jgi:hypothetical protein
MDEQMIRNIAHTVTKGIIETLKEYRAAGKNLDDVIAAFEKQDAVDKIV